jgi:2-polyprenyl-3-methyl-5-hydroxy-6-metoxy-1,4-benzoquinol methylase
VSHICPVCQGASTSFFGKGWDSEYLTSTEKFDYYKCSNCAAIFLPNPPVDRLHVIYPSNYYAYQPATSDGILQRIKQRLDGRLFRELLGQLSAPELGLLDVGGGSGWLATTLRKLSPRITATHIVDFDASAAEAARSAGHVFHAARIEDFVSDKKFDLIIMLNLIEHVLDPGAVLRALRSVAQENSFLLLKTPNTDNVDSNLFRNVNWGGFHCPRHWVLFDEKNLSRLAAEAGWRVEWVRYTQGAPQLTTTLMGYLHDKKLIHLSRERPMHEHWLYPATMGAMAAFDFLRMPFTKPSQMFMLLSPNTR